MSMNWDPETPDSGTKKGPQPVVGSVATQMKQGKKEGPETVKEETVKQTYVAGKPAVVGFAAGLTLKLGNFEMARLDVRIEHPCEATPPAEAEAFEYCKTWVADRLQAEVEEIRGKYGTG